MFVSSLSKYAGCHDMAGRHCVKFLAASRPGEGARVDMQSGSSATAWVPGYGQLYNFATHE